MSTNQTKRTKQLPGKPEEVAKLIEKRAENDIREIIKALKSKKPKQA